MEFELLLGHVALPVLANVAATAADEGDADEPTLLLLLLLVGCDGELLLGMERFNGNRLLIGGGDKMLINLRRIGSLNETREI